MVRHANQTRKPRPQSREGQGRKFSGHVYGNPDENIKQRADKAAAPGLNDGDRSNLNPALPESQKPNQISDEQSGNIGVNDAAATGTADADRTRPVDIDPREPHNPEEYGSAAVKPHYTPPFDPQAKKARK